MVERVDTIGIVLYQAREDAFGFLQVCYTVS